MVYYVCYRMLNNAQDAEDAAQDVFIKGFYSICKFRSDAKLSTWLYRITINTCLNRERRKKIINWLSLDILFNSEEVSACSDNNERPDLEFEKRETEKLVQHAIHSLSLKQRTAIILYHYEGLSYKQIAEVMNKSLPAVESLLHHGKDNLARKLLPLLK